MYLNILPLLLSIYDYLLFISYVIMSIITKPNDYQDLFSKCYQENCILDQYEITQDDLNTLNKLEADEVFENLSNLINDLLRFKKQFANTDDGALAKRVISFEDMVQKLENSERNHFALENEFKLIIENYEYRIDEMEIYNLQLIHEKTELEAILKGKNEEVEKNKVLLLENIKKNNKIDKDTQTLIGSFEFHSNSDNIFVQSREFLENHKRTKSDFEFCNKAEMKKLQTIKSVKFEYVCGKLQNKNSSIKLNRKSEGGKKLKLESKIVKNKSGHFRAKSNLFSTMD